MATQPGVFKGTALIRVVDEEAKRKVIETLEANGMADLIIQRNEQRTKGMPEPLRQELVATYERNGWPVPKRLQTPSQ